MELDQPSSYVPQDGEHDLDSVGHETRETTEEEKERERKQKLHARAIADYKASADFYASQRKWESEWRKFYRALERADQWSQDALDARGGYEEDGKTKGERPCLTMNEIKQPVQQGINEARQARLGLYVKPEKGEASKVEAETRQGILRGIQYHSNAVSARMWALESAFVAGRGFYRVNKEYANDGDDDIDLVIGKILHQDSVHPDPASTQTDLKDATRGIITDDFACEEFVRRFPNAKKPARNEQLDAEFGDYAKEWINDRTYRVGEYFYVEQFIKIRYRDPLDDQWKDVPSGEVDENGDPLPKLLRDDDSQDREALLPKGVKKWRPVPVRKIKWCLFSAAEILDEADWEGDYIPIMQTVGRVHVVDGKVNFKGLVHDGMNPQQLINYAISSLTEQTGMGSRAPYLVDSQQIEQFKAWWDNLNIENYPYLPYKRFDDEGNDIGVPQRNGVEPPILATLQVLSLARELLKACMGRYGAALGDISPDRSGRAIDAMKVQAELGSSDFLDNMATDAMTQESRVLNSMMFPIYGYEGRYAKMLAEEGEEEQPVLINKPFTMNPEGRPVPVDQPNMIQRAGAAVMNVARSAMGRPAPPPPEVKEFRLTKAGTYSVRWVVGKSKPTLMQENVEVLTGILETVGKVDPQLARAAAIALLKNLDGPAAKEVVDSLTPKGPDGQEIPAALQQVIAQLEQQRDEATNAAMEMQQELKGKKLDLDRQERLEAQKQQFQYALEAQKLRVEMLKIETQVQGKLSAEELKIRLEELKGEQRKLELMMEQAHEKEMQATELAHDDQQQAREINATERQQATQLDAAAASDERKAVLGEASRQNTVRDTRVDTTVQADREDRRAADDRTAQSVEAERDRQAAERQAKAKAVKPKE
jgi:hypothetical protein